MGEERTTTQQTVIVTGPMKFERKAACLVVIHGEQIGKRVDVEGTPLLVGRGEECDLRIPHPSVSRVHCQIWQAADGHRVRDLDSTNKTYVNDREVKECQLNDGDHLTIGKTILKFIARTSIEAQYHDELYQLATTDVLTDLHNRRHFLFLLENEISRAERHDRTFTLLYADLDHFKSVNDDWGHQVGDRALKQIAQVISNTIRADDFAARIGGEEFAILLAETPAERAIDLANRIRERVSHCTFRAEETTFSITISIGLAEWRPGLSSSQLQRQADDALYQAKADGRDQVKTYQPDLSQSTLRTDRPEIE